MNDGRQPTTVPPAPSGGCAARQFIAILFGAVALGLIYNTATPLGVRAPKTETPVASPVKGSRAPGVPPITRTSASPATVTVNPAPPATNVPASTLRWAEVKPLLEAGEIVLVDARAKSAYDLEHIPGALSLPTESAPEAFVAFALEHSPDTAIVVYCSGENCDLSRELGEKLRKDLGFKNVREMPGGIVEYRLAESKSTPPGVK